jgi:serine/threonine protein kinase
VDHKDIKWDPWRKYLHDESGGCILQGVVLDEIVGARSLNSTDGENTAILESGREGLKALHRRGILNGDVKHLENAMVTNDSQIVWMDFSMSEVKGNLSRTRFARKAKDEITLWNPYSED